MQRFETLARSGVTGTEWPPATAVFISRPAGDKRGLSMNLSKVVAVTTGVPFGGAQGLAGGLIPWALAGVILGARGAGAGTTGPGQSQPG